MRRVPKFKQDTISDTHQLVGSGKLSSSRQAHKGVHEQAVVRQVPLGTVKYGAFGLAPQAEPLHLQISPNIIK